MKKYFSYTIMSLATLCLINTGFQSSEKKEPPAINFYGTIETASDVDQAQNITISGLYENIPVYGIPQAAETSPMTNVTSIRLDEIATISHQPGPASIKEFQNRSYIEISVEFEDKTVKNYLVERSRKLNYEIPFSNQTIKPLEKEVLFEALIKATIKGYMQRARKEAVTEHKEKSAAKEAVCTEVKRNLALLEKESNGMFKDALTRIKESVTYLCS